MNIVDSGRETSRFLTNLSVASSAVHFVLLAVPDVWLPEYPIVGSMVNPWRMEVSMILRTLRNGEHDIMPI